MSSNENTPIQQFYEEERATQRTKSNITMSDYKHKNDDLKKRRANKTKIYQ